MSTAALVPTSFDEMYRHYRGYIIRLVASSGIAPQDAEDVAHAILSKFYEKDALSDFNPEYTSSHQGVVRKASFLTFLSGFVKIYVRHYRERQVTQRHREPTLVDYIRHAEGNSFEDLRPWIEVHGDHHEDRHEDLEEYLLTQEISSHLQTVPRNSPRDRCDLAAFFRVVLAQSQTPEGVNNKVLAEQFEVSTTTIQNWMLRLRAEVQVVFTS